MGTDGHLDIVVNHISHDSTHGTQPVKFIEHQTHDTLYLLVRIDREFAGWQFHVADGRMYVQLAASGFVEHSLVHPALKDVQFGFAHHSS